MSARNAGKHCVGLEMGSEKLRLAIFLRQEITFVVRDLFASRFKINSAMARDSRKEFSNFLQARFVQRQKKRGRGSPTFTRYV